jgi:dihydropteroate synthase
MGILNVTPDSFSDGGKYATVATAVARAQQLRDEGADIIDVGGESTRPNAQAVDIDTERARVMPVIERLAAIGLCVSIDTQKPALMHEALCVGASIVNDVNALQAQNAIDAVLRFNAGICLMHRKGSPSTMQIAPAYENIVEEVAFFLRTRVAACERAGIATSRIVIDPGFGFGKTVEHNFQLLRRLKELADMVGKPLLAGISRKASLGAVTGRAEHERVAASTAAALLAVSHGAMIVRVHDVAETVDALKVWGALETLGQT